MAFTLMALPYAKDALKPHMSEETLEFHHGKHHNSYVDKLNGLVEGNKYSSLSLEEIIVQAREAKDKKVFNNAAQIWNHDFFWNGLSPKQTAPSAELKSKIEASFGSLDGFKTKFSETAANTFGSGWAWLALDKSGNLELLSTSNAENPVGSASKALLTCDVWEHAYYIDYRNARPKFLEAYWSLVNWDFVAKNLKS